MNYKFFLIVLVILNIFYTNTIHSATKKKKSKKISSKVVGNYPSTIVLDSLLDEGVLYKNILFGKRKNKISANILEIKLNSTKNTLEVLKALDNINELEKLQQIIRYSDSTDRAKTIAAVNGSFWRAAKNNPIGPCIIDGNVIEQNPYKDWSSCFIDTNGTPFIDNFKLSGSVKLHDGKIISISTTNRRRDSAAVVFYNFYGGEQIPHLSLNKLEKQIEKSYMDFLQDSTIFVGDSTEQDFSYDSFRSVLIEQFRAEQLESSIFKAVVEFIDKPGINKKFRAVVNYIDTGTVKINSNQGVLSLGFFVPPDLYVMTGDTLEFTFYTNVHKEKQFNFALSATPRLVRHGKAGHEAYIEGSRSRRFINGHLGRTAIGYNQAKDIFYLVTIDHPNSSAGKKGASLGELAQIMKQIGCYDAMNLDGGGSSIMVIDGKNIMAKYNPEASRRISVAIGVRKKDN